MNRQKSQINQLESLKPGPMPVNLAPMKPTFDGFLAFFHLEIVSN